MRARSRLGVSWSQGGDVGQFGAGGGGGHIKARGAGHPMAVDEGVGVVEASLRAARMRLRPIIMTSLAFVFGVLPLAISTGAGAASRQAIGTAVVGGMLSATFLAIFFVPLFYVLVMRLSQRKPDKTNKEENPS